jgi:TnpA family transposase
MVAVDQIQPDTLHGDTQAQSTPVFGLSHLLGIQLMPRIRNVKDLVFFKPEAGAQYKHIQSLLRGTIDWELIRVQYRDMMRVAVSIKMGQITPSMILRHLGTYSRKNKLYFAFKELGQVIRTLALGLVGLRAPTNSRSLISTFAAWSHSRNFYNSFYGVVESVHLLTARSLHQ